MHPAYSVIFFTTASGAGYGLLILLALLALTGDVQADRWLGVVGLGLGLALVTAGLISSTFHLGRPERAWRAFSQWQSSWLSREGVVATATYLPAGLFGIGWVFFETVETPWAIAGAAAIVLAAATVICTGMIYASLQTIRQWNHPLVVPVYLLLALATGAILLNVILILFGQSIEIVSWIALLSLLAAALTKLAYWRSIDNAPRTHTAGDATGLGRFGTVRPLDPPHSRPNFVMREMGFSVARKHARRLRLICLITGFAVPVAATAVLLGMPSVPALLPAAIALVAGGIGVVIERWLFFAEAEHVVMLYYGRQNA